MSTTRTNRTRRTGRTSPGPASGRPASAGPTSRTRRTGRAGRASAGDSRRAPWSSADSGWLVGIACGSAVLLSAVAMQPLLRGGWWLPMTVLVVALIAVVGAASRGLRVPAPAQPLLQAVALVGALVVGFTGPVEGVGRVEQLRLLAAQGREYAEATAAPAGADLGLLLLLAGGIGLAAIAVDTLAADVDLPGLALVPLAALFAVPWAINDLSAPWWTFAVVAVAWLIVLLATQHHRLRAWSEHARPGSAGVGLLAAVVTLSVAILGGAATAAREPFGGIDLSWGRGGSLQVDTLVSLRRSLVGDDDRVVLSYTTTGVSPEYFRTAVLEDFDGTEWQEGPRGFLAEAPPTGPAAGAQELAEQPVQVAMDIGPLAGAVVPSPWGTISSPNSWPVLWDQRTAILYRTNREVTSTRAILVVLPREADAQSMRNASVELVPGDPESPGPETLPEPPAVEERYPDIVIQLAREVTADATTPYDRAVALQRWFSQSGGFDYSTDVAGGSGDDALVTFLEERIGYCEQYAAAMAVMARVLGIPSRVAVGFTQGTQQEDESWIVRASDAHAWPELWMGAAGWVRFEPTPGASTTRTPVYTLDQAPGSGGFTAPSAASPGASASAPNRLEGADDGQALGGAVTTTRQAPIWAWALLALVLVLVVPALLRYLRRLRRMRRDDPESAYAELADTMTDLGLNGDGPTPRTTLAAVTSRLVGAGLLPEPPSPNARPTTWVEGPQPDADSPALRLGLAIEELRDAVERGRYGPTGDAPAGGVPVAADLATAVGPATAARWGVRVIWFAPVRSGSGGRDRPARRAAAGRGQASRVVRRLTGRAGTRDHRRTDGHCEPLDSASGPAAPTLGARRMDRAARWIRGARPG